MHKQKMICIVGESCSGKDTLVKKLSNLTIGDNTCMPVVSVLSYTTRPKRENETDGIEHIFIKESDVDRICDKESVFAYTRLESKESGVNGYEYFATKEQNEYANVYIIDPDGIDDLKCKHGDDFDILIVYVYSPLFVRNHRAKSRSDYSTEYRYRVMNEKFLFFFFKKREEYDIKINNFGPFQKIKVNRLYKKLQKFLKSEE